MWQFFTERGKRVVQQAHKEALKLGHDVIGTEHILLGLISENDAFSTQLIRSQGVDIVQLRERIESAVEKGEPQETPVDLPLSARAKRVLDLSMREARRAGVSYVGTEHILLGVLEESNGVAHALLTEFGVSVSDVRQEILNKSEKTTGETTQTVVAVFSQTPTQNTKKSNSATPTLDSLGIELSEMAKAGDLDPVIGREKEISRLVQILCRRTKNNPMLIGDPGVGKTAVVEGLAQRIENGDIPEILRGKRVVQLNISNLVAGTKYRGEFEERMRRLVKELQKTKNVILFLDEIHTIVGAGGAEGSVDAANILKPSLARGEFQVIGATTLDEHKKYVERDAALARRFQPITIDEPNDEDCVEILQGLKEKYEQHHNVVITDEAIKVAVDLSKRYIADRYLPDKAIDLLDEASAFARIKVLELPETIRLKEQQLKKLREDKDVAASTQEFETAASLRDDERRMLDELTLERDQWLASCEQVIPRINGEDIAGVVSQWTGIPVRQLTEAESKRLLKMEDEIHKRMVGQEEALCAISRAIRRARSGMKDPRRPIGSFLFLGPTGVGKTELARSLAEFLFGSEDAMIRFDMSEYMEKHEVSKLIGAPPGYVGFEEGGKLTELVRRRPYSIILFDEIEKAHPDVFNMLLQLLEDGRLTDGQGRRVDFRNTVIVMTSNVGAQDILRGHTLGFSIENGVATMCEWEKMKSIIMEVVRKTFKPEFLNRIDETIVFKTLSKAELLKIVDIMLESIVKRAENQGVELLVDEAAREHLVETGYDPKYGARPIRRNIQSLLEDHLADCILDGTLGSGGRVQVTVRDNALSFLTVDRVLL